MKNIKFIILYMYNFKHNLENNYLKLLKIKLSLLKNNFILVIYF